MHEYRRSEMLKIFDKVNSCTSPEDDSNSNLTKAEQAGMKSLKARVQSGDIVITETDKSKRFCVLTREQYLQSGHKHTLNDREITTDDLAKLQKNVNDHCHWLNKIEERNKV